MQFQKHKNIWDYRYFLFTLNLWCKCNKIGNNCHERMLSSDVQMSSVLEILVWELLRSHRFWRSIFLPNHMLQKFHISIFYLPNNHRDKNEIIMTGFICISIGMKLKSKIWIIFPNMVHPICGLYYSIQERNKDFIIAVCVDLVKNNIFVYPPG